MINLAALLFPFPILSSLVVVGLGALALGRGLRLRLRLRFPLRCAVVGWRCLGSLRVGAVLGDQLGIGGLRSGRGHFTAMVYDSGLPLTRCVSMQLPSRPQSLHRCCSPVSRSAVGLSL